MNDRAAPTRAMRSLERAFLLGVPGTTEILLVRHGDCYDELQGDLDVDADPPLSATGCEQARRLAERLQRLEIDAVYASPLRRARETAEMLGRPFELDERLVEVAADTSDGFVRLEEVPEATVRRMRSAVADAVAAHPGGRVVMVGHGVTILQYLCDVMRLQPGTLRLLPYYTSINVVRVKDERRMVGALADIAHLEGMAWLS
ncbi:MAG TPA: histidine phosphatase family protein [Candidatus Dormibacteraeota bacterium]